MDEQQVSQSKSTVRTAKDDERKVKGIYVICALRYLDTRYSATERQAIYDDIPAAVRAEYPKLNRAEWYPLNYVTDLFAAMAKHSANPGETLTQCGMSIAEEATNTFLKLLMKLLTPKLFARKFPEFWAKYHNFGTMTPDLTEIDDRHIVFHTTGYDYMHYASAGWVIFVFKTLGKRNPTVTSNCPPDKKGMDDVILDVRWDA